MHHKGKTDLREQGNADIIDHGAVHDDPVNGAARPNILLGARLVLISDK